MTRQAFSAYPSKERTATDYHRRVERVVDLIREQPAHPFTVGELAQHAAFSEFHFHRIFRATTGESVAQCVIRLRLEMAINALVYQRHLSLTEIALSCGFSSSANFSKAFRKAYGCTPTQYRQTHSADFRMRRNGKAEQSSDEYPVAMSDDVEIRTLPDRTLASLRLIGPYTHTGISRLYAELGDWYQATLGRPAPDETISITWSDPALAEDETLRLDACHEVPAGIRASGRVMMRKLIGGRTACLTTRLPVEQMHRIAELWDWMFSNWLPRANVDLADRPAYELYRTLQGEATFDITLCLPLANKHAEHEDD